MSTPMWIKSMLDARGVPYEECHHREVFTAQDVAHEEHISGHRVAKVVVILADGKPFELILPASRRVELERVRELLGVGEARLASEQEMKEVFPGCDPGAIPPLRQSADVPVLMDASLQVEGKILFQAGTHEDAVRVPFEQWFELVRPRVETFTAPVGVA